MLNGFSQRSKLERARLGEVQEHHLPNMAPRDALIPFLVAILSFLVGILSFS